MKNDKKAYRAALYLRLSKDDGAGESASIGTQRSMLRAYAAEHGFDIYDEYVDESVIFEPSQKTLAAQGFLVWFNFFCSINGQQ